MLNPKTDFFDLARATFALTPSDPLYYTDLPAEHGSRIIGEYELAW
jgi:hypothetical protein